MVRRAVRFASYDPTAPRDALTDRLVRLLGEPIEDFAARPSFERDELIEQLVAKLQGKRLDWQLVSSEFETDMLENAMTVTT